jgi:hypothetical protein
VSDDDFSCASGSQSAKRRPAAPLHPAHPERVCWGCERLCPADALACGNGTIRTLHPIELFGDDWAEWFERHRQE